MTPIDIKTLRGRMDATQAEMARLIGLSLRAYQDLEAGSSQIKRYHLLAMERASMQIAVKNKDPMTAAPAAREDARIIGELLRSA